MNNPGVEDSRRFYNTPDVSLLRRETGSYLAVSLGSGYRAHPLDTQIEDSFYSVRDFNPFRQLSGPEYATLEAAKLTHDDARLADLTGKAGDAAPSIPSGAWGWRIDLPPGEKARVWPDLIQLFEGWQGYEDETTRSIRVFSLDPF